MRVFAFLKETSTVSKAFICSANFGSFFWVCGQSEDLIEKESLAWQFPQSCYTPITFYVSVGKGEKMDYELSNYCLWFIPAMDSALAMSVNQSEVVILKSTCVWARRTSEGLDKLNEVKQIWLASETLAAHKVIGRIVYVFGSSVRVISGSTIPGIVVIPCSCAYLLNSILKHDPMHRSAYSALSKASMDWLLICESTGCVITYSLPLKRACIPAWWILYIDTWITMWNLHT